MIQMIGLMETGFQFSLQNSPLFQYYLCVQKIQDSLNEHQ